MDQWFLGWSDTEQAARFPMGREFIFFDNLCTVHYKEISHTEKTNYNADYVLKFVNHYFPNFYFAPALNTNP